MPYIKKSQRYNIDKILNQVKEIKDKGQLEYMVFKLMKIYMKKREFRYSTLHDCVYAIIHAGEEFKRRFLDIRENQALKDNGDI